MKYRYLIHKGVELNNKFLIEKKLKELNFHWLILAEFENAEIEIENDTIIWNWGVWYSGRWKYGIFKKGEFLGGIFENGIFISGDFKGIFKSGVIVDINTDKDLKSNKIKFLK